MQEYKKLSKSISTKVGSTPEGYLVDFIRTLEEELHQKSKESAHYMNLCSSLKKKLLETESIKAVLYNYVNMQKYLKTDTQHKPESPDKTQLSTKEEPATATLSKSIKYEVSAQLSEEKNLQSEKHASVSTVASSSTPKEDAKPSEYHLSEEDQYCMAIDNIKILLRNRYKEIGFFDLNDLDNDDPLKLLTVLKLIVDNYCRVKDAYRELYQTLPKQEGLLEKHELLVEDVVKFCGDVDSIVNDSEDLNLIKRFSSAYSYLLSLLSHGIMAIIPDPTINVRLLERIEQIKDKYTLSCNKNIEKLTRDKESRRLFVERLTDGLNYSVDLILNCILFDPLIHGTKMTTEGFEFPKVGVSSDRDKHLLDAEMAIKAFVDKLIRDGKSRYNMSLKQWLDINSKLRSDYELLTASIERMISMVQPDDSKLETDIEKIKFIEDRLASIETQHRELAQTGEIAETVPKNQDFNNYLKFVREKLVNNWQKERLSKSEEFDIDTVNAMDTVVESFKSILDIFSKTSTGKECDAIENFEIECEGLVKNIDLTTIVLSDRFKHMKGQIISYESKNTQSSQELEHLKNLQSKMDTKMQELEAEIESQGIDQALNLQMMEATSKVAEVCESVMKYSTDLLTHGLKIRKSDIYSSEKHETDSDRESGDEFKATDLDMDEILRLTSDLNDETPHTKQDKTPIAETEDKDSDKTRSVSDLTIFYEKLVLDVHSMLHRLEESTDRLLYLNISISESKKEFENEEIYKTNKICELSNSLILCHDSYSISTRDIQIKSRKKLASVNPLFLKLDDSILMSKAESMAFEATKNETIDALIQSMSLFQETEFTKNSELKQPPFDPEDLQNLLQAREDLLNLNVSILESKQTIENDEILIRQKIDTFMESLHLYSECFKQHISRQKPKSITSEFYGLELISHDSLEFSKSISKSVKNSKETEIQDNRDIDKTIHSFELFSEKDQPTSSLGDSKLIQPLYGLQGSKDTFEDETKLSISKQKNALENSEKAKSDALSGYASLYPKVLNPSECYSNFQKLGESSQTSINLTSPCLESKQKSKTNETFDVKTIERFLEPLTLYSQPSTTPDSTPKTILELQSCPSQRQESPIYTLEEILRFEDSNTSLDKSSCKATEIMNVKTSSSNEKKNVQEAIMIANKIDSPYDPQKPHYKTDFSELRETTTNLFHISAAISESKDAFITYDANKNEKMDKLIKPIEVYSYIHTFTPMETQDLARSASKTIDNRTTAPVLENFNSFSSNLPYSHFEKVGRCTENSLNLIASLKQSSHQSETIGAKNDDKLDDIVESMTIFSELGTLDPDTSERDYTPPHESDIENLEYTSGYLDNLNKAFIDSDNKFVKDQIVNVNRVDTFLESTKLDLSHPLPLQHSNLPQTPFTELLGSSESSLKMISSNLKSLHSTKTVQSINNFVVGKCVDSMNIYSEVTGQSRSEFQPHQEIGSDESGKISHNVSDKRVTISFEPQKILLGHIIEYSARIVEILLTEGHDTIDTADTTPTTPRYIHTRCLDQTIELAIIIKALLYDLEKKFQEESTLNDEGINIVVEKVNMLTQSKLESILSKSLACELESNYNESLSIFEHLFSLSISILDSIEECKILDIKDTKKLINLIKSTVQNHPLSQDSRVTSTLSKKDNSEIIESIGQNLPGIDEPVHETKTSVMKSPSDQNNQDLLQSGRVIHDTIDGTSSELSMLTSLTNIDFEKLGKIGSDLFKFNSDIIDSKIKYQEYEKFNDKVADAIFESMTICSKSYTAQSSDKLSTTENQSTDSIDRSKETEIKHQFSSASPL